MLELLADDFRQFPHDLGFVDVGEQEIHGAPCRFFLAMRVVDQNIRQVVVDLFQPTLVRVGS